MISLPKLFRKICPKFAKNGYPSQFLYVCQITRNYENIHTAFLLLRSSRLTRRLNNRTTVSFGTLARKAGWFWRLKDPLFLINSSPQLLGSPELPAELPCPDGQSSVALGLIGIKKGCLVIYVDQTIHICKMFYTAGRKSSHGTSGSKPDEYE